MNRNGGTPALEAALRARVETLERALRVIRTWAAFDADQPSGPVALLPTDVLNLCEKTLAALRQEG